MRTSILVSTICMTALAFNALADAQQNGAQLINLACTPNRCETWHYDVGTKISMTTDCTTHIAATELSFLPQNGSHVVDLKSNNARRVNEVTDIAVKQTLTWEVGGVRSVITTLVSRIDGKYNQTSERYSKWATERDKVSGTCLAASELAKRRF